MRVYNNYFIPSLDSLDSILCVSIGFSLKSKKQWSKYKMRGCNHSFAVKGGLIRGESSLSCHAIIKTLYDDRSRMTTFKRKGLINVDSRSDIRFWAISVMGRVALIILPFDRERARVSYSYMRKCDVTRPPVAWKIGDKRHWLTEG